MAYKALYRSYRPTKFSEIIGQKPIVRTLQNALKENKISHAYIFSGSRGTGKTTIARILAKAANCEQLENGEPCNRCRNCLAVSNDSTTDIIELDAASNNGVDEMRDLLDKVNFLPSTLTKKVYIIDEVHMLTTSAFNALLKTLEEPPSYAIFILATTEPQKLPLTILSRCQRFNFKPLSLKEIKELLINVASKEKIAISDEALTAIAEAADGGMRDALGILDQVSVYSDNQIEVVDVESVTGRVSFYKSIEILQALKCEDASSALSSLSNLIDSGKDANNILNSLIQLCRDLLLYKTTEHKEFYKYIFDIEEFQEFVQIITTPELFYYVDVLVNIQNKIKFSNTPKIFLEIGLMKIVNRASEEINIIERLNEIDNKLALGQTGYESNYELVSPQAENRLNIVEGKIKRITTDLEKLDIKGFKETVVSKLNLLEDSAAFISTLPRDIVNQIELLKENIKELTDNINLFKNIIAQQTLDSNHQKETSEDVILDIGEKTNSNEEVMQLEERVRTLEEKVENTKTTDDPSNNEEVIHLEERVRTLEEKVVNVKAIDDPSNNEEVIQLKERVRTLEEKSVTSSDIPTNIELPNIENLEKRMQNLEEYNELVINRVDELSVILDGLKKIGMEINKDSLYNQNKYLDTIKEVEELKENFLVIIKKIQDIQNTLSQNEILTKDENENSTLADDSSSLVEEIKQEVETLKTNVDGLSTNFESMIMDKIETLKDIYTTKEEFLLLKGNVESIQVKDYQDEIQKLQDYIDSVKEYSFKLNIKVTSIEEELEKMKSKGLSDSSKKISHEEVVEEKPQMTPIKELEPEPIVDQTTSDDEDITSRVYDVRIIERILNQSRSQKCREERIILLDKWGKLENNVGHLLANTARLLTNGKLIANGETDILVVYPNATLCNHLMEERIHLQAKQVLRITFGREYDFIALPENVWQTKRSEYYDQHGVGITYPKLTPIKDPSLKIVISRKTTSVPVKKTSMEEAESLFGSDIVTKEEDDK